MSLQGAKCDPDPHLPSARLHCIGCGYDLTGATIGGVCPECALPVARSVLQSEGEGLRNVNATAALTMGVLSLILAAPLGLCAIYYFRKAHDDRQHGRCARKAYRAACIGQVLGCIGLLITFFYAWLLFAK